MIRALRPRKSCMEKRLALAGVQMPPNPLLGVIINGCVPPTLRTAPLRSPGLLHPNINPAGCQVQFHLAYAPRIRQTQKFLIKFCVFHSTSGRSFSQEYYACWSNSIKIDAADARMGPTVTRRSIRPSFMPSEHYMWGVPTLNPEGPQFLIFLILGYRETFPIEHGVRSIDILP